MRKRDSADGAPGTAKSDDLEHRVARYRARLIAEGRVNSVKQLDRSVAETSDGPASGKAPR
jgi:hypothetical protein